MKGGYDESLPYSCTMCGRYFDDACLIEVDGYDECFDCLVDDPEVKADLRISHPELFKGFFQVDHYTEKLRQAIAYLEGSEATDPEHPEHKMVIYRALDRVRDAEKALSAHLEFENEVADLKATNDYEPPDNEPPYSDAVDDMDGASELPPMIPHTSLDDF